MTYGQDWCARWAVYQPGAIAVKDLETGEALSYAALHRAGNRLAAWLFGDLGLRPGDRLAVLSENSLEYIALFVAAQRSGLTLVPLNYRMAPPELDYLLGDSEPAMLCWQDQFEAAIRQCERLPAIGHRLPLREVRAVAFGEGEAEFPLQPVPEDHPVFILYTSGTTGFPKGALYSHKMLFWNSVNTALSLLLNSESRTVTCLPPFHTGGWNVLTTPLLHRGGFVGLMPRVEPEKLLRMLEQEQATIFMGVPTVLQMMSDSPYWPEADLSSLMYAIVGGEPMPIPLIETWHAKGIPVRQGFGMTEVGPNLTSLHQRDAVRKKGSIGRPNFYVQTRLVDSKGEEVPPGEAGELLFRGPMVTPGYWRNEAATRKTIVDGWFHSGDMAVRDEEGYLFIVDRIKNMFISGGENVYPAEVERMLLEHPAVAQAVVVGVPDPKWGEVGYAYVVAMPGETLPDLKAYCKTKMAAFKVPKYFQLLDEIPVSATGKVHRKALGDQAKEEVGRDG